MDGNETLSSPNLSLPSGSLCELLSILTLNYPYISFSLGGRYFVLTLLQTAYAYWVEGKTIFIGKRRTLANRVRISSTFSIIILV